MRVWLGLAVASIVLAGCSNPPSKSSGAGEGEGIDFGVEATATTGVIRGVVYDEAIRPLLNANVTLAQASRAAVTDDQGAFGFQGLEPGTYFLTVKKLGFKDVQQSAEVVAGVDEPAIVKVMLLANPSTAPYVEALTYSGYLSFGAAIFATSIGTTIYAPVADALGDRSIWTLTFTQLPQWAQGELVWEQTQPAGGQFIWEMTEAGSNSPVGYRETTGSPALTYWNTTVLLDHNDTTLDPDRGIAYRFFGGPHPACKEPPGTLPLRTFGCGLTVQQKADAFIHNFYNFVPAEAWRYTVDGDPVIPK